MDHDIRPMLDRADEVRCAKGIVDHNGYPMSVCDFSNGINIRNIAVRIAERLQIDRLRILPDRRLDFR